MTIPELIFLVFYFNVLAVVSIYGAHRYFMAFLYYRHKYNTLDPAPFDRPLPRVTIQLPLFNEMYVCERLIDSVCAIEYPRERLEIQVLDDSTDETQRIAAASVELWRSRGVDVEYIH